MYCISSVSRKKPFTQKLEVLHLHLPLSRRPRKRAISKNGELFCKTYQGNWSLQLTKLWSGSSLSSFTMGGVGLEILFVSAILLLSLLLKALFGPKRTYMYYPPTNYFVWCKLVGWLVSGEPCFSKDGRSDISRILIPSPYPTAGLCPKTLHLDLAILPTEGDSIQVLPAALSFWKRERYRLSYWGRCGESIGHIVVQATTHWKEEPIVQVTSAL